MHPFLLYLVGWSEARSPTAVVRYAPNVGLRASLQPTKNRATQKTQLPSFRQSFRILLTPLTYVHVGMSLAGIQNYRIFLRGLRFQICINLLK